MAKKITAAILAVLLIAAMLPTVVFAVEIPNRTDAELAEIFNPDNFTTLEELSEVMDQMTRFTYTESGDPVCFTNDAVWSEYRRYMPYYQAVICAINERGSQVQITPVPFTPNASNWAVEAIIANPHFGQFEDYRSNITRFQFIQLVMSFIFESTEMGISEMVAAAGYTHNWFIGVSANTASQLESGAQGVTLNMGGSTVGAVSYEAILLTFAIDFGITDGQHLYNPLTREQAATMMMRAIRVVNQLNVITANIYDIATSNAMTDAEIADLVRQIDAIDVQIGLLSPEVNRDVVCDIMLQISDLMVEQTGLLNEITRLRNAQAGIRYIDNAVTTTPIPAPTANFNDMAQVSSWAVGGVNFVRANGIMNGSGGNFSPKQNLTVEMAIVLINNINLDRINS
jgi:hypothetical protein